MTPFVYHEGRLVWERNRWLEDNADTVFVLNRDLVQLDPSHAQDEAIGYDEMLLFNQAQFTPPLGEPAAAGERRLNEDSIELKGLQLYVNYGDALVDPGGPSGKVYDQGMFFISLSQDGISPMNAQPLIPVPVVPFSGISISASRGTFGKVTLGALGTFEAFYVTASIGFDANDLQNVAYAKSAAMDQFYIQDPLTGAWSNRSLMIPASVRETNNSGVAFVDLNGDGNHEIYVGRHGNEFAGMQDVVLEFSPASNAYVVDSTLVPNPYAGATTEVIAADVDQNGHVDIVVSNRSPWQGVAVSMERNFVLLNDGTAPLKRFDLLPSAGANSDSRSVAVGDVAGDGRLEIVFGNAGSDGYGVEPEIALADDDPIQIWSNRATSGGISFFDVTFPQIGLPAPFDRGSIPTTTDERAWTSGLTFQVLLQDLVEPRINGSNQFSMFNRPDGLLDLVIVNHRYAIRQATTGFSSGSNNVQILANRTAFQPTESIFNRANTVEVHWAKTVCFSDYVKFEDVSSPPVRDFKLEPFVGTGNRFGPFMSHIFRAVGESWMQDTGPQEHFHTSYDTIPGNERGYGFDFARTGVFGEGLDAVQTSRGYQFLTIDMLNKTPGAPPSWLRHWDLTEPVPHGLLGTPGPWPNLDSLYHRRGMSTPHGAEDGCFADLDGDGTLELLVVGNRNSSRAYPYVDPGSALVSVLNSNTHGTYDDHERTLQPYYDLATGMVVDEYYVDDKIDSGVRFAYPTPNLADRVQAADLDNDGDIDAIVSLFPVRDSTGATPVEYVHEMGFFTQQAFDRFNYGFMYLRNVYDPQGGPWFEDVAPSDMVDDPGGTFSQYWNRGLGDIALADLDNNGAIDLFAVQSPERNLSNADHVEQLRELIFLNGTGNDPVGRLRELSNIIFPSGPFPDIVARAPNSNIPPDLACGGSSVDWGDVDNDGDVDLLVARGDQNYPGLMINQGGTGSALSFVDSFPLRVPVANLDPIIASTIAYEQGTSNLIPGIDGSTQARFIDFDADGDLDMILTVPGNLLRILENTGTDSNADGKIDASDSPPPGYFADVTSAMNGQHRVLFDSSDTQVIDIDLDGDYDFAADGWRDEACFWRNELPKASRPAVSEVWPRIGALQGSTLLLRGANLTGVNLIELTYANSVWVKLLPTNADPHELSVTLPADLQPGFARIRVGIYIPSLPRIWSTQYMGYCVLGN